MASSIVFLRYFPSYRGAFPDTTNWIICSIVFINVLSVYVTFIMIFPHSKMSTEDQSPEEKKIKKANKNESHIPVLSPTHFKRTGSLKLRNEMRMPHKSEPSSSSTPPLRRHRSLVCRVFSFYRLLIF